MARIALERPGPPAVQDSLEKQIQGLGSALMACCAVAAALCPGILLGAAGAALWRWIQRPPLWVRLVLGAIGLALAVALQADLTLGWVWRDLAAAAVPGNVITPVNGSAATRSLGVEVLAGPFALEAGLLAYRLMARSLGAQIRSDQRADRRRWRAVTGRSQLRSLIPDPHAIRPDALRTHPPGHIRLGIDRETNQPFDLELPGDIARHVFMPGITGAGKTNTLARLADGALANGWGVVIIDCKGGGMRETSRDLAARYGLPFYLVDPMSPDTLGYNPCSGDGPSVANKLVGSFTYGPNAEIYKNAAMESVSLVVDGLRTAGIDVTLESISEAFRARGIVRIAQRIPEGTNDRVRLALLTLAAEADNKDELARNAHSGMKHRLGALLQGTFGDLFRAETTLDWNVALAHPSITHIALSALAADVDVELMGRVIAQDLKQICAHRLQALGSGEPLTRIFANIDEFPALNEPAQLPDLAFMAREALVSLAFSGQYLPESLKLRKGVLGAGLFISHTVESDDSNDLAEAMGTHLRTELTNQMDFLTGFTDKGSIRQVDAFNVHPNDLRQLPPGYVAVRSLVRGSHAIVKVFKERD